MISGSESATTVAELQRFQSCARLWEENPIVAMASRLALESTGICRRLNRFPHQTKRDDLRARIDAFLFRGNKPVVKVLNWQAPAEQSAES